MRLSTQGQYGLKIMFYLAKHQGDKPINLTRIAEDMNLPKNYLEQLMKYLRQSGLVESFRGAQGGYKIIGDPKTIRVGDVLRAMEDLYLTDCLQENHCQNQDYCSVHHVWQQVQSAIDDSLNQMTLQDIVDHDRDLSQSLKEE